MREDSWERVGAGAGVVFVALLVVSAFIVPQPPHIDASTARISAFVTEHRRSILIAQVLAVLAVPVFLWFVGMLRHVLDRAEGGAEALSPIVMVSGAALAAVGAMVALPMAVLAFMAGSPGGLADAATVRLLFDTNQVVGGAALIVFAPFLLAMGFAMVRKELVAPWLGWVAMAIAAVDVVAGAGGMTQARYHSAWNFLGLVGFLGAAAVVLIASVSMMLRPEADREVVHPPVFAHS